MNVIARAFRSMSLLGLAIGIPLSAPARAADPFAANNGLYPEAPRISPMAVSSKSFWPGPLRTSNFDYPASADSGWLKVKPKGPITLANAADYMAAMKAYLAGSMKQMIEDPDEWSKSRHDWYSPPWTGAGTVRPDGTIDPSSGREAILGSFTGQVIRQCTFAPFGLTTDMQNHTVIYYDPVAALTLRHIWRDPNNPQVGGGQSQFAEGAIVLKAGAVNATPDEWPVTTDSTVWNVFRPPLVIPKGGRADCYSITPPPPITFGSTAEVTKLRVLQFDMIVKDKDASPKTGFVFLAWVYECRNPAQPACGMAGSSTWDRLVPLGAEWGSDPEFATNATGTNPDKSGPPLLETWINPAAPAYAKATLGWGGRMSGPIDVSVRTNVHLTSGGVLVTGTHVSSCMGCHISSQYPFIANLYPSPNRTFPQEGQPFLMFPPGSPDFARWFQDLDGGTALSAGNDATAVGLSYDMVATLSLSAFNNAAGHPLLAVEGLRGH